MSTAMIDKDTNNEQNNKSIIHTGLNCEFTQTAVNTLNTTKSTTSQTSITTAATTAKTTKPLAQPITPTQPPIITTSRITNPSSAQTTTPHTPLFKTLSPLQKAARKRKLCTIKKKLGEKSVDELTTLYNQVDDPDFRNLMSKVYHENCMARLQEWEQRL
ncbi:unnamed protein product [Aureobasidium uvarum]|uniref:Uncharacterized protein n=1 Tax=Aureobasidium uvarum TaxID=2773716 RepID=A0A9N8K9A6_9PEZI|nr:unnamed protein product [Aureobasidium uvarum]